MNVVSKITLLVEPICRDLGVEVYDVDHRGGIVRVIVERAEGVDIDVIALITRELSRALDEADPLPGRYTLEVSSPGLERPLRAPWHFERAIGKAVKFKTKPHVEGERRVDGTLVSADEQGCVIAVDGATATRCFLYDDIERAQTIFVWEAAPKPGKQKSPKSSTAARTTKETTKKKVVQA